MARPLISSLTGIRALAAIWVVAFHFHRPFLNLLSDWKFTEPVVRMGFLGVDVFFLLSGFIIAYNYAESIREKGAYTRYLWARIARIYPVLLAVVATMAILVIVASVRHVTLKSDALGEHALRNFIGNIVMLQAVPPFHAVDGPSWSLSCESWAYLAFPLIALGALKCSPRAALLWAALILSAEIVAIHFAGSGAEALSYPVMWLRIAGEFSAGVFLWRWWSGRDRAGSAVWDIVAAASLAATIAICCAVDGRQSTDAFIALPFIALFIVACASARGYVARFLSSALMVWLGRISYSLYMTHYIVYRVVKVPIPWEKFVSMSFPARVLASCGVAAIMILAAAIMFYLVEEPCRRVVRRCSTYFYRSGETTDAATLRAGDSPPRTLNYETNQHSI